MLARRKKAWGNKVTDDILSELGEQFVNPILNAAVPVHTGHFSLQGGHAANYSTDLQYRGSKVILSGWSRIWTRF